MVDTVLYDDVSPWPEDPDGNGPTLELINPLLDNAVAGNWTSCEGHGTPGEDNCTYVNIEDMKLFENITLTVFPNPINTHAVIMINTEHEIEDFQLEIFNSLGMQVKIIPDISSKQIDFNRENLPDGFYICLLVGNNNRIFGTAKIIIN